MTLNLKSCMVRSTVVAAAVLLSAAFSSAAQAHFIWVVAIPGDKGETKLQLSFGEGPQPAEAYLLDKVSQSKMWTVAPDGSRSDVKLAKEEQGDEGAWVAKVAKAPAAVEVQSDPIRQTQPRSSLAPLLLALAILAVIGAAGLSVWRRRAAWQSRSSS